MPKKEKVKYDNNLNSIRFGIFHPKELDVFVALLNNIRLSSERGEISFRPEESPNYYPSKKFSYEQMREVLQLPKSSYSNYTMLKYLDSVKRKLLAVQCKIEYSSGKTSDFALFPQINADPETQTIEVFVNPQFAYLITDLSTHYTEFELNEYRSLKLLTSKVLYQKIKQYKNAGQVLVSDIGGFREQMQFSQKTRNCDIIANGVKPAVSELQSVIPSLEMELIKTGSNHEISGFKLNFQKDKPVKDKKTKAKLIDFRTA